MNTVDTEWIMPGLQEDGTHLVSWDFFIIQFFYSNFGKRKVYIINMVTVMCKRSHLIDRENLSKNYKLSCRSKYQDRSLTKFPMLKSRMITAFVGTLFRLMEL